MEYHDSGLMRNGKALLRWADYSICFNFTAARRFSSSCIVPTYVLWKRF